MLWPLRPQAAPSVARGRGIELEDVLFDEPRIGGAFGDQAPGARELLLGVLGAATRRSMSDSACVTVAAAASRSLCMVLVRASACAVWAFAASSSEAASSRAALRGRVDDGQHLVLADARSNVDGLGLQIAGHHRIEVDRFVTHNRPRLNGRARMPPTAGRVTSTRGTLSATTIAARAAVLPRVRKTAIPSDAPATNPMKRP